MMELLVFGGAMALCSVMVYCVWALLKMEERARDERRELEDRLMAICQPIPLMQVTGERTEHLGAVSYVGEEEPTARMRIKSHEVD